MSSFKNAIPKFVGKDDHASNLSGDVISELTTSFFVPAVDNTSCTQVAPPVTFISKNVTITRIKNKLTIRASGRLSDNNGTTINIYRDATSGTSLAVVGPVTTGPWNLGVTLTDEPIGAHIYNWVATSTGNTCSNQNSSDVALSEANDSHAAALVGSNTIKSHETEVLP